MSNELTIQEALSELVAYYGANKNVAICASVYSFRTSVAYDVHVWDAEKTVVFQKAGTYLYRLVQEAKAALKEVRDE